MYVEPRQGHRAPHYVRDYSDLADKLDIKLGGQRLYFVREKRHSPPPTFEFHSRHVFSNFLTLDIAVRENLVTID